MKRESVLLQIRQLNKNVISISDVYNEMFSGLMSELAFFKSIERLTKTGELTKISKGIYGISTKSKYGIIAPSENEILSAYIGKLKGVEIGYRLYNSLNITTQISKQIKVYSNVISSDIKRIKNIEIKKVNLTFSSEECEMIKYIEVLSNFENIQDINRQQFIIAMNTFAKSYNNEVANKVIEALNYKKRTVAFMRDVLDYYKVENDLSKHLSCYSEYKYPKMVGIYESAQRLQKRV